MAKLEIGINDLVTVNPNLTSEWDYEANKGLINKKGEDVSTPNKVTYGSQQKVWWKLPYVVPMDYKIKHLRGKHFDFKWEATIKHRNKGAGCPYLSNQALWKGFNDLETVNPELASQWDFELNKNLKDEKGNDISTPDKVFPNSRQRVWWTYAYDVPMDYPIEKLRGKHFDFKWNTDIIDRVRNDFGCPYLTGRAIWKGFNDLQTINPELAEEWDYEANKGLRDKNGNDISTPDKIGANSNHKVGWKYSYDVPMDYPVEHLRGKHFDFKWESKVEIRNLGGGCPYLSGRDVWKGFNDLETTNPQLASEWDYEANKSLIDENGRDISTPDKITNSSQQKVWWQLSYDVPISYPIEHLRGKHFDFKWEAQVSNRNQGAGCPYLTGNAVWKGFNDLATTHPELTTEWDYEANKGLKDENGRDISTPDKITAGSGQKVNWIYSHMDNETKEIVDYKWKAEVNNRSKGCGCPFVLESKGEKAVRKILNSQGIIFEEQNIFKDRFYKTPSHPLRDDFAVFDVKGKVIAAIEFHGQQHYEPVDFAGKGNDWAKKEFTINQERDRIKTNYLKTHGIKQLIIPYWEFDNGEEIVKNFIDELSKDFNLQKSNVKAWTPSQGKSNEKEVKAFMHKLLKSDTNVVANSKPLIQNKNELSIDI